jgi:hypothetical protein
MDQMDASGLLLRTASRRGNPVPGPGCLGLAAARSPTAVIREAATREPGLALPGLLEPGLEPEHRALNEGLETGSSLSPSDVWSLSRKQKGRNQLMVGDGTP